MAVGDTKSFHVLAEKTALFTKAAVGEDNKNREPEHLIVVGPVGGLTLSVSWFRFIQNDEFVLVVGKAVAAGDTLTADLTGIQFRDNDILYVTPSAACDIHLHLDEPLRRRCE